MMNLEVLQQEMITAMKEQNKIRKETLSAVIDAIKKATITDKGRIEITEELINTVLLKEKKIVQEMISTCPAARKDLLDEYECRLAIINEFAPQLITVHSEIKRLVHQTGIETTKANRGAIMKALKGKVDMKEANIVLGGMLQ